MNLLKALATVSSMTLVSRILGFVRDLIIARIFGAGVATDAFFVAFRIPNLLRRLFAEGAFSQAFVPVLAEYKNNRTEEQTRELIDHVATLLGSALFIVTLVGILAAPLIIYISAPGFAGVPDKFELTIALLRITFPYILFISLVAFAGGILNTYSHFSVPALTPVLLNLSFIGCALWLAPLMDPPVLALAWAVFIGGMLQLAFQIPFLLRLKRMPRLRFGFRDSGAWRVLKLMGPAVFGVSIGQISLLINTIFASLLITGSVSWLYYADRLMEFPAGMLGVALGTVILPSLSRHYTQNSTEEFSRLLDWGLRLTFLLTLPAAVALALLATPLITTLFYYGAFTVEDVWMTREALIAYSVGLLGLILVKVLAPGFYARQNIKTPVKVAILTLAATQLMNLAFIIPLKHAGLALAISLGACLNAGVLYSKLRSQGIYQPLPGWGIFIFKILVALIVMGAGLWLAAGNSAEWFVLTATERAIKLGLVVILGGIGYFACLWMLRFRLRDFARQ
ncbi:MAG TPA: murein biosynthesis integral membrane protein MurJ [Nitrosomonas europaea]|uniref:murein biosynthesis integral membrane protein MurJ n=1 Tax=Nitrosomonas europaea TaxID=915 RepID=UPI00249000A3|nr:murein biosynthesis integral membrane protein MurJ [Nitrosomonas europaea]HRN81983.1 murein biosynthesis integral membrane protein MurJ [Nitrosomonas europaea]HRO56977.1 murein biosynthesis integral membrane protein MurJ [Nitrosomonas europaea]HRQ08583.1 murein biosynthesis integral membrane protein MurJ [Nitrosomonas europaea]HUM73204.1 murein biosynthesis integral membrane protein MurJ [Nitrosomonas europaea]